MPDDLRDVPVATHLVALVEAARGPATAEELADEAEIVAAMAAAQEAVGVDRPRRPLRLVGRVVAAKGVVAVGVVVFGVAAAAAATGVVASVVSSDGDGRPPPVTTTSTSTPSTTGAPADGAVVEHPAEADPGRDPSPAVPSAEPDAPGTHKANGNGNGNGNGSGNGNGEANGNGATAGSSNPPVILPPQAGDAPGHSGAAPSPPRGPSTPGGDRRHGSASTPRATPPPLSAGREPPRT